MAIKRSRSGPHCFATYNMRGCIKLTMNKLHSPICALSFNTHTHTHTLHLPSPFFTWEGRRRRGRGRGGGKGERGGGRRGREPREFFLFYTKLTKSLRGGVCAMWAFPRVLRVERRPSVGQGAFILLWGKMRRKEKKQECF